MMRLILTTTDTGAGALRGTGIADVVIGFDFRFVWGPLPLQAELASFLEGRSAELFPHHAHQPHKVFGYWEAGSLLEGLARCPAPVISGLGEGPFTEEIPSLKDRHDLYKQSRLSLTDLGKAVLAGKGDFGRHNPIHRWWGGTELTNERLWRWDRGSRALVAP